MVVVHLIRHGAPALRGVLLGSLDSPLESDQMEPSELRVQSVFSSPLKRAHRTAELLFPGQLIEVVPELAEIGMGAWQGKTWREVEYRWPVLARSKSQNWAGLTPPRGERWSAFVARVTRASCRIRQAPSPVAVVAHAGVNAVLAQVLAGVDAMTFLQSYGEVTSFEVLRYCADSES